MARAKDWNRIVAESHDNYIFAFDYDGSNNLIYLGKSDFGTSKDTLKWQIRKLTYSGSNVTDIQWPNGDDSFQYSWTLRTSYTYT